MSKSTIVQQDGLQSIFENLERLLLQSRFMKKCMNKTIQLKELNNFIVQHAFYSQHFTRYICTVLSNLENQESVICLVENLYDELGLKENSGISHAILYQNMVKKMNIELSQHRSIQTERLIETMLDYCRNPDPIYGVTALYFGAESIVPVLYSHIINGFEHNHVPADQLVFFKVHVQCDDEHANALRIILLSMLDANPEKYDIVKKVSYSMINLRTQFLDALVD